MFENATLITSDLSPYGRIVRVARLHMGLQERIALEKYSPQEVKKIIAGISPIAKVPVLLFPSGQFVADSRNILQFFDCIEPEKRLCPSGYEATKVVSRLALVYGILDAALALLYEDRFHSEGMRSEPWIQLQSNKILRTVKFLLKEKFDCADQVINIDSIAFTVALEYLRFRFSWLWNIQSEEASEWIEQMQLKVPSLRQTSPV